MAQYTVFFKLFQDHVLFNLGRFFTAACFVSFLLPQNLGSDLILFLTSICFEMGGSIQPNQPRCKVDRMMEAYSTFSYGGMAQMVKIRGWGFGGMAR